MNEDLKLLEYSQIWLEHQLLTPDILSVQILEFKKGEDPHTEHYRYKTFKSYLQNKTILTDETLTQIFEIIKIDNDDSMASAMGIDILKTKSLTDNQFTTVGDFLKETFGDHMQNYIDKEIVWRIKAKESQQNK